MPVKLILKVDRIDAPGNDSEIPTNGPIYVGVIMLSILCDIPTVSTPVVTLPSALIKEVEALSYHNVPRD